MQLYKLNAEALLTFGDVRNAALREKTNILYIITFLKKKEIQNMLKTYIGYARVSTEDQNEARQLESFRTFREPITKNKCSGKNMIRPQHKNPLRGCL